MTNPYILERRASSLESVFPRIDARQWEWASQRFAELGCPSAAERAASIAAEHRMLADRLDGIVPVGANEDDNPFANAEFAPMSEVRKVRG